MAEAGKAHGRRLEDTSLLFGWYCGPDTWELLSDNLRVDIRAQTINVNWNVNWTLNTELKRD